MQAGRKPDAYLNLSAVCASSDAKTQKTELYCNTALQCEEPGACVLDDDFPVCLAAHAVTSNTICAAESENNTKCMVNQLLPRSAVTHRWGVVSAHRTSGIEPSSHRILAASCTAFNPVAQAHPRPAETRTTLRSRPISALTQAYWCRKTLPARKNTY